MVSKILVATDGSYRSEQAAYMAISLAKNCNASLLVLSVLDPGSPRTAMDIDLDVYEEIKEDNLIISKEVEAERVKPEKIFVSRIRDKAAEQGLKSEGMIRTGNAANEIISCIEETSPDIVVLGTHGRGPIATAVKGSVATKVIHAGVAPVLVVPSAD